MKRFAIALLATAALSVPALAQNNAPSPQQQPQAGNSSQPQQAQSQNNNAQQNEQNQANNQQPIQPQQLSKNEIREVQSALNKNGDKVGRVDGRWGPRTSSAVRKFQESKNIQANGQLDQQTLSDLGLNGAQFAQSAEQNSSQNKDQNSQQ